MVRINSMFRFIAFLVVIGLNITVAQVNRLELFERVRGNSLEVAIIFKYNSVVPAVTDTFGTAIIMFNINTLALDIDNAEIVKRGKWDESFNNQYKRYELRKSTFSSSTLQLEIDKKVVQAGTVNGVPFTNDNDTIAIIRIPTLSCSGGSGLSWTINSSNVVMSSVFSWANRNIKSRFSFANPSIPATLSRGEFVSFTISSSRGDTICPVTGTLLSLNLALNQLSDTAKYSFRWNTYSPKDTTTRLIANKSYRYEATVIDKVSKCELTKSKVIVARQKPQLCIRVVKRQGVNILRDYGYDSVIVETIAGRAGTSGDAEGVGTSALFNRPTGLFYRNGNLFVADRDNHKIKKINLTTLQVETVVGNGLPALTDGFLPLQSSLRQPNGVTIDDKGNLFISNLGGNAISKWHFTDNLVYLIAGSPAAFVGYQDGIGENARFDQPRDLSVDAFGNVYVSDYNNHVVRKLTPFTKNKYQVTTPLGKPGFSGFNNGTGNNAELNWPYGITIDGEGNIKIGDEANHSIRNANLNFSLTTLSGIGTPGNYPATLGDSKISGQNSIFRQPWNVTTGIDGVTYVCDAGNNQIKKIDQKGNVRLLAGRSGIVGSTDGGGAQATFNGSSGIAVDENGTVYVADRDAHVIRRIRRNKEISMCRSDSNLVDIEAFCGWESSSEYTWEWILKRPSQNAEVLESKTSSTKVIGQGDYIVTLKRNVPGGNCTVESIDTIRIKFFDAKKLEVVGANSNNLIRCLNDSLTIKATPGFASYTWNYVQNNVAISRTTPQPNLFIEKLFNTTNSISFNITANEANGCSSSYSLFVNFPVIPEFELSPIENNICQGDSLRLVVLKKATPPTINVNYIWPSNSRIVRTGLPNSANYTETAFIPIQTTDSVTVISQNATILGLPTCRVTKKAFVKVNPAPNVTVSNDTALCGGILGQVNLVGTAISQFTPITTKWYNAANTADVVVGNTRNVNPTSSVAYVYEVTDAINCVKRDTVKIGVASTVMKATLSFTNDTLICPNTTIDLLATGSQGTPFKKGQPYIYNWSTNNNSNFTISPTTEISNPSVSPIQSTTYRVVVRDSLGCTDAASVNVNIVDFRIEGKFPTRDTSICYGSSLQLNPNAQIINQRGGPYIFNWNKNTPLISANNILSPIASPTDTLNSTTYILRVIDQGGCSIYDTVTLSVNKLPKATVTTQPSVCTGNKITLQANAFNTISPYSFEWSEPSNQSTSLLRNDTSSVEAIPPSAQPVASGTLYEYFVKVKDGNGCESNSIRAQTIALLTPVLGFQSKDTVGCKGNNLILNASNAANGTMQLSYNWFDGISTTTNPTKVISEPGTYIITVTESTTSAACTKKDTIRVRFDNPLEGLTLDNRTQICKNDTLLFLVNIQSGDGPVRYIWEANGASGNFKSEKDRTKPMLKDTIVYVPNQSSDPSTINFAITASNVCNTLNANSLVGLNEVPLAKIQSAPNEVFVNTPAFFTQSSIGYDSLFWNFKDGTPILFDNGSSVSHVYSDNGIFNVTLTAKNNAGCSSRDSVRLEVIKNQILFIPNVFSPNAKDIQNQSLRVLGMNIQSQDFGFEVYNKWGEIVYETQDYAKAYLEGWNGKYKNTGSDQGLGVYTYRVKGKFLDGSVFEKVGTVTLLR